MAKLHMVLIAAMLVAHQSYVSKDSRLGNIMESGWKELRAAPNALRRAAVKCPRHLSKVDAMRFYRRLAGV